MGKKLVVLACAIAGGMLVAKKRRDAKAEADLWHEATSSANAR